MPYDLTQFESPADAAAKLKRSCKTSIVYFSCEHLLSNSLKHFTSRSIFFHVWFFLFWIPDSCPTEPKQTELQLGDLTIHSVNDIIPGSKQIVRKVTQNSSRVLNTFLHLETESFVKSLWMKFHSIFPYPVTATHWQVLGLWPALV